MLCMFLMTARWEKESKEKGWLALLLTNSSQRLQFASWFDLNTGNIQAVATSTDTRTLNNENTG